MNILPPIPTEPAKREAFISTWKNEVKIYRKHPTFIIGMVLANISVFALMWLTDGLWGKVAILAGIFGVAAVYDVVTRHFCNVLIERQMKSTAGSKA